MFCFYRKTRLLSKLFDILKGESERKVKLRVVSGIMLTLCMLSMLTLAFEIQQVKASGTVYIRADGSVDPSTANITSADNVTYIFTDNNCGYLVIQRDNIVVDGAGYILRGPSGIIIGTTGIDLEHRSNVTIKNMEIRHFTGGIVLWYYSSSNIISGNNFTDTKTSVCLYESSNNTISGNKIDGWREGYRARTYRDDFPTG